MVFKKKLVKPRKEQPVVEEIAEEIASSDPEEIVAPVKDDSMCAEQGCYEPRAPGARNVCLKHV